MEEESPIRIGILNRDYGYNHYEKILKGTPVYEFENRYYFEMKFLIRDEIHRQVFIKETLKPHITFDEALAHKSIQRSASLEK